LEAAALGRRDRPSMFIGSVTQCGICEHRLHRRLDPAQWCRPRHWSVCHGVVTVASNGCTRRLERRNGATTSLVSGQRCRFSREQAAAVPPASTGCNGDDPRHWSDCRRYRTTVRAPDAQLRPAMMQPQSLVRLPHGVGHSSRAPAAPPPHRRNRANHVLSQEMPNGVGTVASHRLHRRRRPA